MKNFEPILKIAHQEFKSWPTAMAKNVQNLAKQRNKMKLKKYQLRIIFNIAEAFHTIARFISTEMKTLELFQR